VRAGMASRGGRGTERFLAAFAELERAGVLVGPEWLQARRRGALARFAEVGFPAHREEAWRYTNMGPMVETPFRLSLGPSTDGTGLERPGPLDVGGPEWTRLVFVEGRFSPTWSTVGRLPGGVRAGSLADALRGGDRTLEAHLGAHAVEGSGFTALNTACFQDGAFVVVPAGVRLPAPVHVLFLGGAGVLAQPRSLVLAGPGSEATIIEHYVGPSDDGYLTSAVTELVLEEDAVVRHHALEEEGARAFHVRTVQADLDRDSAFFSSAIALGGRLVRQNLGVLLRSEGGRCELDGLYLVGTGHHVDHHVTVDHAAPRGTSRQLYKGILDGQARAVFNGRILVRRDAQKTDAKQTNKTLLLTEGPEVYSKPQLEIFADDVRCTHGAAEGQLAEEALFYLKSRGVSEVAARTLLTHGFAQEVIQRIDPEPVREYVERAMLARLRDGRLVERTP
jgi:Fe-S cluster assembly protein SufD